MSTMKNLILVYKNKCTSAHLENQRMGLCFAYASMDKHKSGTCVSKSKEY